jgi:uncharacterized membrane protein
MSVLSTVAQLAQGNQNFALSVAWLKQFFGGIKLLIAFFGAIAILFGAVLSAYRYFFYRFSSSQKFTTDTIRLDLARSIILGLEFFVASDVIETTIAPDFSSLGILGLLVLIRTFLNFTLQKEVERLSV